MDGHFLDDEFEADIDLTPLIDVVFMLLLFFILAASFSRPVMQVMLPESSTAVQMEEHPGRLVFSIDESGQVFHSGAVIGVEEIAGLLEANPEEPVELQVDRAAPFDAFVGVMDPLRAAGRTDVLITAKAE